MCALPALLVGLQLGLMLPRRLSCSTAVLATSLLLSGVRRLLVFC